MFGGGELRNHYAVEKLGRGGNMAHGKRGAMSSFNCGLHKAKRNSLFWRKIQGKFLKGGIVQTNSLTKGITISWRVHGRWHQRLGVFYRKKEEKRRGVACRQDSTQKRPTLGMYKEKKRAGGGKKGKMAKTV